MFLEEDCNVPSDVATRNRNASRGPRRPGDCDSRLLDLASASRVTLVVLANATYFGTTPVPGSTARGRSSGGGGSSSGWLRHAASQ